MDGDTMFWTRRQALKSAACGFGYVALAGLANEIAAAESAGAGPLAPRAPHFRPRAKRVIFLFMQGGPSHVDTFDHKPVLQESHGARTKGGQLMASPWEFQRHGESGLPISELYPELGRHADELCLLNGCRTDNPAHPQATIMLHTGSINFVRPSVGAWTVYGLGTENNDLPGFVTINPQANLGGAQNYGNAFLPAMYQGTRLSASARPGRGGGASFPNIANPSLGAAEQRRHLDFVQSLNRDLLSRAGGDSEIEGVIESFELAYRMQSAVPEVMDIASEPETTKELYGIDRGPSAAFGVQCLMARRLAEAGVRYIELAHNGWDQHNSLKTRLAANAAATDRPIAGLIADLKQRGMLDDTLIVWGGEFGRTPQAQAANMDGRRHNNRGFTMWMAGGGVRGGLRHGATDEHGGEAVEGVVHTHDLHATMLHLMGLDHERLTYRYAGRDFRLTDVHGNVVEEILA